MMWFFPSTLIWYYTGHTAHTGDNRLTHPYKYILTPPVMCLQQLTSLNEFPDMKNLLYRVPQCLCFSKITDL